MPLKSKKRNYMRNFKVSSLLSFCMICTLVLVSCTKNENRTESKDLYPEDYAKTAQIVNLPDQLLDYQINLPEYYNSFSLFAPQINDAKATLGRVIFYDTNLSENKEISCASCHDQSLAFSDNVAFSKGINGHLTDRNSLALGNAINFGAYYGPGRIQFFWDDRAESVQEQSTATFKNEKEMGMEMSEVVDRIQENPELYDWLFKKAYRGDKTVLEDKVLESMTEFINSLGSHQSKFDDGMEANYGDHTRDFHNFTASENLGKALFTANCSSCHSPLAARSTVPLANNGLDMVYSDKGVYDISGSSNDKGVFKVPGLRNIELTGPYMHDGRFETLEEVVDFYSTGIQNHPTLHNILRDFNSGNAKKMNFTTEEKAGLVAFLKTLSDDEVTTAERFSDPFIN